MSAQRTKLSGFTFIELLIIVAIIIIVVSIVLVSVNQARRNTRINATKTSMKSALLAMVDCNNSRGTVNPPSGSETGNTRICSSAPNIFWPKLEYGYTYAGGDYNSDTCWFKVSTDPDVVNAQGDRFFVCDCVSQACR